MGELNSRAGADVAQDKAARAAPREPRAQWLCADDEVSAAATSAFEAVDDDDEERSGDRADFEEMAFELDSLPCSTEIEMDCLHSEGGKEDLTDEAEHVDDSDDDEDDDIDLNDWVLTSTGLEWEEQKAKWLLPAASSPLKIFPQHMLIPPAGQSTRSLIDDCDHVAELTSDQARPIATDGTGDSRTQSRYALRSASVKWRLFAGCDFPPKTAKAEAVVDTDSQSTEHQPPRAKPTRTEILDALLENYHPLVTDAADTAAMHPSGARTHRAPSARPARKTDQSVEVHLKCAQLRADVYNRGPQWQLASGALLAVEDFNISQSITQARLLKALSYWKSDRQHPRESHDQMLRLHVASVGVGRDPNSATQQRVKVRLLPLRCHLRYELLQFVENFFSAAGAAADGEPRAEEAAVQTKTKRQRQQPPSVELCNVRACKLKIDYQGKQFDLKRLQEGSCTELLNLFPLEGVELTLERVRVAASNGSSELLDAVMESWVRDITSTQLHKFVAGTTPIRSLSTIGSGVADLVLLPVQQYRRDGRLLRGLKKGTTAFVSSVTVETLTTSCRLAKYVARTLDDIVTDEKPSHTRAAEQFSQPDGLMDGLEHARDALSRGMNGAVHTIVAVPLEYKRAGMKSVIKAVPVAVLRPVIGVTEAAGHALLGVRNSLAPFRKEDECSALADEPLRR